MRGAGPVALLGLLGLAVACGGARCEVDGPLDYGDDAHWLCRPGIEGDACAEPLTTLAVAEDGSTVDATVEPEPDAVPACFAVYPTLDLRPWRGLHHRTDRVDAPRGWARGQAGRLAEVCRVYVPVYRQVALGTYGRKVTEADQQCTDSAYGDVEAAFDAFLEAEPDAPIVLFGHSQGGQHLSRLLAERFDDDVALRDRLVVAYPLGWPVGTDADSDVGGSFATIPECTGPEQTGCVVAFRSYLQGGSEPTDNDVYREGEETSCVNPAAPGRDGWHPLAAYTSNTTWAGLALPDGVGADEELWLRWDDGFEARCTAGDNGNDALQVRWVRSDEPPVDLDERLYAGTNGAHVLDVQLSLTDVVRDAGTRADAWLGAGD